MHILEVRNAHVHYGKASALEDVSLAVRTGEITGLFGRNGAGKTTLLNALMGLHSLSAGEYLVEGKPVADARAFQLARAGISLVPADRQIYGGLTVADNLALARLSRRKGARGLAEVFALFPRLKERFASLAENLSGGEKQMLAIGRALLMQPRVLLLDEPTEGLAPLLAAEVINAVAAVRDEGVSVLIVEQNLHAVASVLDHAYVLDSGRMTWSGSAATLLADPELKTSLLSI